MLVRRGTWAAIAGVLLAVLVVSPASAAVPQAQRVTYRGAAGTREYMVYVPAHTRPIPLVVYLHGCGAPPSVPGLNEMAQRRRFAVAYPIQARGANASGCWNWDDPNQRRRGVGEPAIIAGITRKVMRTHGIDPASVYLTGHSAGSGMTANVAAAYPDLYASAAIIAGCGNYACLDVTGHSAFTQMGEFARAVPVYILWGTADPTNPYWTGRAQALQWVTMNDWADDGVPNLSTTHALSGASYHPAARGAPAFVTEGFSSRCGDVELASVIGMGHVPDATWPVAFPAMVDFLLGHPMKAGCSGR